MLGKEGNYLHTDGELSPVEEVELKKCSFVKRLVRLVVFKGWSNSVGVARCVMESARLHAPGAVVRKVVKTHTIQVMSF